MENLNEYDITKRMINEIRGTKRIITEDEEIGSDVDNEVDTTQQNNENNSDNQDEEELTSAELSDEQKKFRDTVSPRVEFTSFFIYPKNKNAVFSGKFKNLGGLEWEYTLEDSDGLYISCDNVQMTEDAMNTIKKLKGYYLTWAEEWAEKISTEYNSNDGGGSDVQIPDTV